ncbi:Sphingolipid C9-methyltransferase 2 [Epichloe bromicola]|uniref:Sphingolipid C9-methyltransferase 2 n=1 Tax=Epichloe bromicola TaxID=79588 RepID=A0ABQ0CV81_9HYPO
MASKPVLESHVSYIKTPKQVPSIFEVVDGASTTDSPTIHNSPLPDDGAGSESFSNILLGLVLLGVPFLLTRFLGLGLKTWLFLAVILFLPLLVAFWTYASNFSPRIKEMSMSSCPAVRLSLMRFSEPYMDGKADLQGDTLDMLEYRHDWAKFSFTWPLY